MAELARDLGTRLSRGERLWLFLDYDGTLAEFAPNPDVILPDPDLAATLTMLVSASEGLRVVILSGRRLSHIQQLLPVPGLLLAGTYGIEFVTPEGEAVQLLNFESERPFLDQLKKQWMALVENKAGFYVEDKKYALALHGKDAADSSTRDVFPLAARMASELLGKGAFRVIASKKFLEVAPTIADKGQSVGTILKRFPWPDAQIVYIGDDERDEEAFKIVLQHGGIPILVADAERPTLALRRLKDPGEVRRWLRALAESAGGASVADAPLAATVPAPAGVLPAATPSAGATTQASPATPPADAQAAG